MKWFDKWFKNKCIYALNLGREIAEQDQFIHSISGGPKRSNQLGPAEYPKQFKNGMQFCIYPATGGYVLEYSSYDEPTDNLTRRLHVIASDQDLGIGVSHIITLEMLRK